MAQMSAQHRAWLADQADKLRATAAHDARHCAGINQELDAWANPAPAVTQAAARLRSINNERRLARELNSQKKEQA